MEEQKRMEWECREAVQRRGESMTANVNDQTLKEDFSQTQEQLLQTKAMERVGLMKRKHKHEKQRK
jgi:hypothetical protein